MEKKDLLIVVCVICVIVVLLCMGMIIPSNSSTGLHTYDLNSTDENSTTEPAAETYLYFNNSTPYTTSISIARLNEGIIGFDNHITTSASLTPDGKYWIVKMHNVHDVNDEVTVTIDTKTLISKKSACLLEPATRWRSLDKVKAAYIAELQSGNGYEIGNPYKITLEGKTIWKVPLYDITNVKTLIGHIYVDPATGKSKNVDLIGNTRGWLTLKEVDKSMDYGDAQELPFKDALRNLYPE